MINHSSGISRNRLVIALCCGSITNCVGIETGIWGSLRAFFQSAPHHIISCLRWKLIVELIPAGLLLPCLKKHSSLSRSLAARNLKTIGAGGAIRNNLDHLLYSPLYSGGKRLSGRSDLPKVTQLIVALPEAELEHKYLYLLTFRSIYFLCHTGFFICINGWVCLCVCLWIFPRVRLKAFSSVT